ELEEVRPPIKAQGREEGVTSTKVVSNTPKKKTFTYQELPGSMEYPLTLDLRRKWTPTGMKE
ncbi:MAG TPA: hypothetical protein VFX66_03380, partial [Sulfuricurvum sp.]|nr:hypothetical protein [Sulfuricurvum sp.]